MKPDDDEKVRDEYLQKKWLEKNLQKDLNDFLHGKVPLCMTVGQFERLSGKIRGLIMDVWN